MAPCSPLPPWWWSVIARSSAHAHTKSPTRSTWAAPRTNVAKRASLHTALASSSPRAATALKAVNRTSACCLTTARTCLHTSSWCACVEWSAMSNVARRFAAAKRARALARSPPRAWSESDGCPTTHTSSNAFAASAPTCRSTSSHILANSPPPFPCDDDNEEEEEEEATTREALAATAAERHEITIFSVSSIDAAVALIWSRIRAASSKRSSSAAAALADLRPLSSASSSRWVARWAARSNNSHDTRRSKSSGRGQLAPSVSLPFSAAGLGSAAGGVAS
mmetsp:Transcript_55981/g.112189  ORF Transcript_55981/g.112189 Transcript_55981/m.112189 type:complete len:280 (-) Transcript_55981:480-1319(-)